MVAVSALDQLPPWASALLEDAKVAHLGLLDEQDHPRVLPVTFALADGQIWSAIDQKPKRHPGRELARVRYLRRKPQAALTVDRYTDDWSTLAWVQILGQVRVLDAAHAPAALASLVAKYSPYQAAPPAGPLLALRPRRCIMWHA